MPTSTPTEWTKTPERSHFDYALETLEDHGLFWYLVGFLACWGWFWLAEGQGFFVALIIAFFLWLAGTLFLIVPLGCGFLALISALLASTGLSPAERYTATRTHRTSHATGSPGFASESREAPRPVAPPPPAKNWVLPLAIGLWIGSWWGGDD